LDEKSLRGLSQAREMTDIPEYSRGYLLGTRSTCFRKVPLYSTDHFQRLAMLSRLETRSGTVVHDAD